MSLQTSPSQFFISPPQCTFRSFQHCFTCIWCVIIGVVYADGQHILVKIIKGSMSPALHLLRRLVDECQCVCFKLKCLMYVCFQNLTSCFK